MLVYICGAGGPNGKRQSTRSARGIWKRYPHQMFVLFFLCQRNIKKGEGRGTCHCSSVCCWKEIGDFSCLFVPRYLFVCSRVCVCLCDLEQVQRKNERER